MKRYSLIGLLTLLVAVTVWAAIVEVPEAPARMTAVVVGGGGGGSAPPSYTYHYSGGTATSNESLSQEGNYCVGSTINDSSSRTAKTLGFYIVTVNSSTECKAALYNTQTEALLVSCTVSSPATGWNDCTVADTVVPTTPEYRVMFMCNDASDPWTVYGGDGVSSGYYIALAYAAFPPATNAGSNPYENYMTRIGY